MQSGILQEALSRTLIAAHRGIAGGNIPGNTPDAFDAALVQGADIIELDVSSSQDGELFVFHPGMEPVFLGSERLIRDMPAAEVRSLRFLNGDHTATTQKVCSLDEVLEHLKGRCYINIDKYGNHVEAITKTVRDHHMQEQVLVKTKPDPNIFARMEAVACDIPYMLMLREQDDWTARMDRWKLNYVGIEALFASESSPIASPAYIEQMQRSKKMLWANGIVYDYREVLSAGHNDDISVTGHEKEGWGWLLDRGFNIIQTDWPLMLKTYMLSRS